VSGSLWVARSVGVAVISSAFHAEDRQFESGTDCSGKGANTLQTWVDIILDPHHLLADFIMNVGFEIAFAWLTYMVLARTIVKRGRGKHRK
jgi:hypothetical protein